jgi:hypothetical protein
MLGPTNRGGEGWQSRHNNGNQGRFDWARQRGGGYRDVAIGTESSRERGLLLASAAAVAHWLWPLDPWGDGEEWLNHFKKGR